MPLGQPKKEKITLKFNALKLSLFVLMQMVGLTALSGLSLVPAQAQTLLYDTNVAPANLPSAAATAAPAPGGTLLSGSGMVDTQGGVWSINSSHQLVGTAEGSSSWQRDNLLFSSLGTGQTGHVIEVLTLPAGQAAKVGAVLAYQSANTKYWTYTYNPWLASWNDGIWKEVAGADTNLCNTAQTGGAAGVWQVVFDKNGSTLTISCYNLATPGTGQVADPVTVNPNGVNGALTVTATDSALTSGGFALTAVATTATYSRIRLYGAGLAASGTVTASTSGNTVTLANAGTAYVSTTPSAYPLSGAGAAGSSVTSVALSNGGQTATLTITAGSVTGTNNLTITDPNGASATISVTGTPALAVGYLQALPVSTGVQLSLLPNSSSVTGLTAGSGSGYSYSIYRDTQPGTLPGTGTLLVGGNTTLASTPYTDTTAVAGTTYYYRVVGTDSAADFAYTIPPGLTGAIQTSSLATAVAMPQPLSINLVTCGDSITANIINGSSGPADTIAPSYFTAQALSEMAGVRNVWQLNAGSNGLDTLTWQKTSAFTTNSPAAGTTYNPGGGLINAYTYAANLMNSLIAAHPAAKPVFTIMLGTNDSLQEISAVAGTPMTAPTFQTNLQTLATSLLTDFPTADVELDYPPYYTPNASIQSALWGEAGLAALKSYYPQIDATAAALSATYPGRVILGDKTAPAFFATNYLTEMVAQSGNNGVFYLHPNPQGAVDLGRLWAVPIYQALFAPADSSAPPIIGALPSLPLLSRARAIAIINAGGSVSYKGNIYYRVQDLPSDFK